jgi:hypothetical protein
MPTPIEIIFAFPEQEFHYETSFADQRFSDDAGLGIVNQERLVGWGGSQLIFRVRDSIRS